VKQRMVAITMKAQNGEERFGKYVAPSCAF